MSFGAIGGGGGSGGGGGGLVADAINDGTTTVAPSQNAVFDALALKAPLAPPLDSGNTNVVAVHTDCFAGTGTGVGIGAGSMVLAPGRATNGQTIPYLSFQVTASSLSAGESVYVVFYGVDPTTGKLDALLVSKSTVVGTGTGFFDIAGGGSTYPTVPFWVGIHNPSSNAGGVTILSTNAINSRTGRKAFLNRGALYAVSQGTTPPSSVSTYTYGTAGATTWEPNEYAPIIFSRGT